MPTCNQLQIVHNSEQPLKKKKYRNCRSHHTNKRSCLRNSNMVYCNTEIQQQYKIHGTLPLKNSHTNQLKHHLVISLLHSILDIPLPRDSPNCPRVISINTKEINQQTTAHEEKFKS
uniref:Uncharacterized protein n=1 Tax=Physcomitrium patens TaxID=3218 RepID=A0A2K1KSV6_PHYPA|nr:hypothetical protein PHYPA_003828 [Physcomitrium patens]